MVTEWKETSAKVLQDRGLGLILYLLYTVGIPNDDNKMIVMFADDLAILSTNKNQPIATDNLQKSINKIFARMKRWIIKIYGLLPVYSISAHINYTLCKIENIQILPNQTSISQKILQNTLECTVTIV